MIIVFGSLNIDMVLRVDKLPRPGETVLCPSYQLIGGGKGGNQAVAASKAGAEVKLFGKVGDDDFGKYLLRSLERTSVDLVGVSVDKNFSTGCAAISVDSLGENMITVASGANHSLKEAEIPDFLLGKGSTLLLQMETPAEENWKLIKRAKKFGARIVLNLAPAYAIPIDILEKIDVLIMNQNEATTLGLHLEFDVISPAVVARRITAMYEITCIVTLGSEGAIASTPEGTWEVKPMKINPIDTTAAGDAFVGILAAALDEDMDLSSSLRKASVGSALACLTYGAQASLPTASQIEENMANAPLPKKIA